MALTGLLAPAAKNEVRAQTDYAFALRQAASEKKPMAVLIGKGDPFAKLALDAGLSAEAKKLLAEKYVCVSVNVETEAGKALAGQFQLTDGLVISSVGGTHQALRQPGSVTVTDLAKHTAAYADVPGTPATTVTVGVPVTASYYGQVITTGGCSGGNCPTYVYPAGYSSCPNGRCPNR
jgi:hypothetical protein